MNRTTTLEPWPFLKANEEQVVRRPKKFKMPPLIAGTFTAWRYQEMYKIEDLVQMLDKNMKDPLVQLQDDGMIRDDLKSIDYMKKLEFTKYVN